MSEPLFPIPPTLVGRVREAAAWCVPRLDTAALRACLRSEELRPRLLEPTREDTIELVVRTRRLRLASPPPEAFPLGRLLAYFPDADLADGAAEAETHGFLDVNNQPPWDTWIAWAFASGIEDEAYRGFLIAWIPDEVTTFIEVATYVNPEECIQWVDLLPQPYQKAVADLRLDAVEPAV